MLGYLFGFNARIGRLSYFLSSIALGIVMTGIIFAVASMAYHGNAKAIPLSVQHMQWPLIALAVTFCLVTFNPCASGTSAGIRSASFPDGSR